MVHGRKYALGHWLYERRPGLVQVGYHERSFLTLDEAAHFVCDFFGRSGSGGLAAAPTLTKGPLADDGRLEDDDNWD